MCHILMYACILTYILHMYFIFPNVFSIFTRYLINHIGKERGWGKREKILSRIINYLKEAFT